ncbi:MAG: glycosyltransferase family 2 protein [Chitinophagaceae bacterium]
MVKVSVIIPNFNHAPFLKQRIDSILQQTFQDFELIILDDCSTDESRSIIEQYKNHPKVCTIIYNEKNSGSTFKQWQRGIQIAKGDWIWIAESDDYCDSTFLEELIRGVTSGDNVVLAYAQTKCFNSNGTIWVSSHEHSEYLEGHLYVNKYMLNGNTISNDSMVIFKKDIFNEIEKSYVDYRFCGDWLIWISIIQKGNVYVCNKVLNYFRKHDKDVSSKAIVNGFEFTERIKILIFLKKIKSISEDKFVELLINNYQYYLVHKRKIQKPIQKAIENAFYFSDSNYGYKKILLQNSKFLRLKNLIKLIVRKNE